MRYTPTVSTPGVYSPADKEPVSLDSIQFELENDPEVDQAIRHLAFSLHNNIAPQKAFEALNEKMFFYYLRAKRRAAVRERDFHEEGGFGS